MENPGFLREKYNLQKEDEVKKAKTRTEKITGKTLPQNTAEDADLIIQNYLDRFNEILERKDPEKRERGLNALKELLHREYIIKPEEIPESYFESIKKKHRDEGHGNIEIPPEYRKDLAETIIQDQIKSLDNWIDYLASNEAKYPDWLKYYTIRSVLNMGKFDKKSGEFGNRRGFSVSPYPDLNREALAIVLDKLEKKSLSEQISFGYDISDDTRQKFITLLEKANFPKLYALAIEEFKPISEDLLKQTEGEWRYYPALSDHMALVHDISNFGTGWCIRGEGMAKRYLQTDRNSLHVFFSKNESGEPVVPRVVIVTDKDGNTTEVRGVAEQENLDQYIGDVVDNKLKDFADGELYKKKSRDMKTLTGIDWKHNQGKELTKEDLYFLYEIRAKIQGFGYQRDPRIKNLLKGRNARKDLADIFDCRPEQISFLSSSLDEVFGGDIIYHHGDLVIDGSRISKGYVFPKTVSGDVYIPSIRSLDGITFPQNIGGLLNLPSLRRAEGFFLPQNIGTDLHLEGLESAQGLVFPKTVGGVIFLDGLESIEGLDLSNTDCKRKVIVPQRFELELQRKYPRLNIFASVRSR